MNKVLIVTIWPAAGGVPSMLKFVVECLLGQELEVTLAYYQPYSVSPELSVPIHRLLTKAPAILHDQHYGVNGVGVGCWVPELEVSHYWRSERWERLIENHDVFVVVAGSSLAALGLMQSRLPFLAWIASDWQGDREHRVARFPLLRRAWDRLVVTPLAKHFERKILLTGNVIALSETTRESLNTIAGTAAVSDVLYMPIDTDHFAPGTATRENPTLGFIGRFEDPRKHISLLFQVVAEVASTNPDIRLKLIGDELSAESRQRIVELGIDEIVSVEPYVPFTKLPGILSTIDIFVLPSFQEGLCIAALEAMSCGVPVVATRCGGPENYIINGENGLLCEHDTSSMSAAILNLLAHPEKRAQFGARARETIVGRFSVSAQKDRLVQLVARQIAAKQTPAETSGQALT